MTSKKILNFQISFCDVEISVLFNIINAAHFLNIKPLINLTCRTVTNMIKHETNDEIKNIFNIRSNFTHEEMKKIRNDNLEKIRTFDFDMEYKI